MNSIGVVMPVTTRSGLARIVKYVLVRATTLLVTVVAAVYLTILIANFGGQIDEFIRADIDFAVGMSMRDMRGLTTEERAGIAEERRQAAYEAAGLNTPFVVRCFRWLWRGLTLDWGETNMSFAGGWTSRTREIRSVIAESLPRSMLVFGTANLLLFVTTVLIALVMTNRQQGWLDRVVVFLSPLSAAPAWVYGVLLNLVAIRSLGSAATGGAFDAWQDSFRLAYFPMLLRQLALPLAAIFLSGLFQGIYTTRSYFQLHAAEDYLQLARAKGLPAGRLQRRHILRPMLPTLLTSFALIFVNLWQEVIILEQVFNVRGIGSLFFRVITFNVPGRTPFIVALVVTFAYLLAITVFILDLVYVIVDPRIRIGNQGRTIEIEAPGQRILYRMRARLRSIIGAVTRRSAPHTRHDEPDDAGQEGRQSHPHGISRLPPGRQWALIVAHAQSTLRELADHPAAMVGLVIIAGMIVTSICTLIAIPYDQMLWLWRDGTAEWMYNPRNAVPTWVNLFRRDKLPTTLMMDSKPADDTLGIPTRTVEVVSEEMTKIELTYPFDYLTGGWPQDLAVFVEAHYDRKRPLVILSWVTPDGRDIELANLSMDGKSLTYRVSQDAGLARRLETGSSLMVLLGDPEAASPTVLQGTYGLRLTAFAFEDDADIDARVVLFGQVFGLAGTDGRRRDLAVPLLWGMVTALAFGLLAAAITTFSSVLIAAVGTWLGGWADILVQRFTEINMILPFLPVSILVYVLYSKSFWTILGVTVLLSIFGTSIKNYRALFLQIRESPYIESALAYGAGDGRIIFRYLIPRVASVLIPHLVILVPSYVFLEASLAFMDVSDPVLPTWGKLIAEGLTRNIYTENHHLILQPLGLLMLLSFAFVMLGISLDRRTKTRLGLR